VIAGFSSRGPCTWQDVPPYNDFPYPPGLLKPDVSGPGVDTLSTSLFDNCTGYITKSGTSMATPHVSGLAALMLEANPELDTAGVKEALVQTAIDLGEEGHDIEYGAGRIDAFAAVSLVATPQFLLDASPSNIEVCAPSHAVYDVTLGSTFGYDEPVTLSAEGLPEGATAIFAENPVIPPATTTMTITTDGATPGDYDITVIGTSPDFVREAEVGLSLYDMVPTVPSPTSPPNGALDVSLAPLLEWTSSEQAGGYDVQIARDTAFDNVVYTGSSIEPSHQVVDPLDTLSEYYWRVRGTNACGDGSWSVAFSFTTQNVPSILLVDDDDNDPDTRSYFTEALDSLGLSYAVWDTDNSDDEPSFANLLPYRLVIWFTGDEWGGFCGPGSTGEQALAEWLDTGGCLLLTSQDYLFDRNLTDFMVDYLGVGEGSGDAGWQAVTGVGDVFGGLGTMSLDLPFANFSDRINPGPNGATAFTGESGDAAVTKDGGVYRTAFLGFAMEGFTVEERKATIQRVVDWCGGLEADCPEDLDDSGTVDVSDLLQLLAAWGNAGGEEDLDGSGTVDVFDLLQLLAAWGTCA
jgi:hypothetical protein